MTRVLYRRPKPLARRPHAADGADSVDLSQDQLFEQERARLQRKIHRAFGFMQLRDLCSLPELR